MPDIYLRKEDAIHAAALIMEERKKNFEIQCAHYGGTNIPRTILSENHFVSASWSPDTSREEFRNTSLLFNSVPMAVAMPDGFTVAMICNGDHRPEIFFLISSLHFRRIYASTCDRCVSHCGNCSRAFRRALAVTINPDVHICQSCAASGVTYCNTHLRFYRGECLACRRETLDISHWRNLSVDNNKKETTKSLISGFGKKPDTIRKKASGLYRPMVRRTNDFRIPEMVTKIGKLPVQLCLIGGSNEFMGDYDIIVSRDLKAHMPTYNWKGEWAILEIEDRFPKTIAISRHIRENEDLFRQAVLWVKDFHA